VPAAAPSATVFGLASTSTGAGSGTSATLIVKVCVVLFSVPSLACTVTV
jgi:hypothetical protein